MTKFFDFLFEVLSAFQPAGPYTSPADLQFRMLLRRLVIAVSFLIAGLLSTLAADTLLSTLQGLSPGGQIPTLQVAREYCGVAFAVIGLGAVASLAHTSWVLYRLASEPKGR